MDSRYFEARSKELHSALLSYAVRRMGNVQDGEDVLGEAMYIAVSKAPTTDITTKTEGFISNWFYKIVEFTVLNARRSRHKVRYNEESECHSIPANSRVLKTDFNSGCSSLDSPGREEYVGKIRQNEWDILTERGGKDFASIELLHKAKARMRFIEMTDLQRDVMNMRLEGASYEEIAKSGLSPTPGAARYTVHYVTNKLRKCKMTSEDEDEAVCADMEHFFYTCCNPTIYRPPTSTGAALAREKIARLK